MNANGLRQHCLEMLERSKRDFENGEFIPHVGIIDATGDFEAHEINTEAGEIQNEIERYKQIARERNAQAIFLSMKGEFHVHDLPDIEGNGYCGKEPKHVPGIIISSASPMAGYLILQRIDQEVPSVVFGKALEVESLQGGHLEDAFPMSTN
jgi:hypothetical protein